MKLLLVSPKFPPFNSNGARRASKFTRFLLSRGHDVRVLTARDLPLMSGLNVEIDPSKITSTPWFNVNFLPELFFGGKKKVAREGYKGGDANLKKWSKIYRMVFHFPDDLIGWYPYATKTGKMIIKEWHPDLIYASGPPFSALMVAARLHTLSSIPWVAEFRDLWADNAYYEYPEIRRKLENLLEKNTLKQCSSMITVSPPWSEWMQRKYDRPVETVLNGFDLSDFPPPAGKRNRDPQKLIINYTGAVYLPYRDPSPLFAALELLGEEAQSIQVHFFSRYFDHIQTLAEKYQVAHLVTCHGLVTYWESLQQQVNADINLLLNRNDEDQFGVIPAKLYEYIGCRRPILAIDTGHGAAADMIRSRRAGVVMNDPSQIAAQLRVWLKEKKGNGSIEPVPVEAQIGLSRDEQFEILEGILLKLVKYR